jgi:dUTP pyrophosphatase
MTLYISADTVELREMIAKQIVNHRFTDSGFDIPMIAQSVDMSKKIHCFSLGIRVAAVEEYNTNYFDTYGTNHAQTIIHPKPCLLLPRSSIYKSPFRLCNSIGLIDSGYRGEVKAMVDNIEKEDETAIGLETGTRMFQLCQHNFMPWKRIVLVDENQLPVPPDNRGSGGFGSTGLQVENHPRT